MPVRYNVAKIAEMCDREHKTAISLHQKIVQKLQEKTKGAQNEKESIGEEAYNKKIEEINQEAKVEIAQFLELSFSVEKRNKISFDHLEGVPLSPIELLSIGEIVIMPDDTKTELLEKAIEDQVNEVRA